MCHFFALPRNEQRQVYAIWALSFIALAQISHFIELFGTQHIRDKYENSDDQLKKAREFVERRDLARGHQSAEMILLAIAGLGVIGFIITAFPPQAGIQAPPAPPAPPAPLPVMEPDYAKLAYQWVTLCAVIGGGIAFGYFPRAAGHIIADCKKDGACTSDERTQRLNALDQQTLIFSRAVYIVGGLGMHLLLYLDRHPNEAPRWLAELAPRRPRRGGHQE